MNLSIEDLEAIKAIVREVVKEELARFGGRQSSDITLDQQSTEAPKQTKPEQPQEVVARIPRM